MAASDFESAGQGHSYRRVAGCAIVERSPLPRTSLKSCRHVRKADVVRQALRIGLPQFAARFHPAPLWLEERIREAIVEPAETVTPAQFRKNMKAIADGR